VENRSEQRFLRKMHFCSSTCNLRCLLLFERKLFSQQKYRVSINDRNIEVAVEIFSPFAAFHLWRITHSNSISDINHYTVIADKLTIVNFSLKFSNDSVSYFVIVVLKRGMAYSSEQNTFIVMSYFRNGTFINGGWSYSVVACKDEYLAKYPNVQIQESSLKAHIRTVINRFIQTGNVNEKKSTGRPQISEEIVEDLRARVEQNPQTSLKRLSLQSGVPLSTCHKVLKKRLHMHPYKTSVLQQLLPIDIPRRLEYCQWFQNNLNDDQLLDLTFFSDEAWFHLSGYVNSQNFRFWSSENPHNFIETPLHSQKIGVWLAVSRRRIYGPIFFDGTINGERYRQVMLEPFINQLDDEEIRVGYFQQDGATAHTTRANLAYLQEFYDNRVISRGVNPSFPTRSPDLTPLDFCLFGYLKDEVFKRDNNNLEELQASIIHCCQNIGPEMLRNIFDNKRRRVMKCLENNGEHFEHLM
jgi:hypothetical protein